jgi:hypothetical protein
LWVLGERLTWDARMLPRSFAPAVHACRAVVAVRLRWLERADAMLRRLRVLGMAPELLDDSDTLEVAAARAGLPVRELAAFAGSDEARAGLRADMALAAERELARSPVYVVDERLVAVGELERLAAGHEPRGDPVGVRAVLEWAPHPLATAEVATVCARPVEGVRGELERAGARFEPVGGDTYWSAS